MVGKSERIAFIGGGNMAESFIGGLLEAGWPAANLSVADPDIRRREALSRFPGLRVGSRNEDAVSGAELVVVAVKPAAVPAALAAAAPELRRQRPVVLSIVAGVRIAALESAVGTALAVVRAMPNVAALIGRGASAFYANRRVEPAGRRLACEVLQAVGETVEEIETESLLDVVTAVSGSGPAYFFLLVEALEQAAAAQGLSADAARRLVTATGAGALELLRRSGEEPSTLRRRVTSPGGTTAAAIEVFADGDFGGVVARAVARAAERARELGREQGTNEP